MDWSGMDYLWIIVMFLSGVWALNLTAPILFIEDLLVSKRRNSTFLQISSDEETSSPTSLMVWGWVNSQQIFIS